MLFCIFFSLFLFYLHLLHPPYHLLSLSILLRLLPLILSLRCSSLTPSPLSHSPSLPLIYLTHSPYTIHPIPCTITTYCNVRYMTLPLTVPLAVPYVQALNRPYIHQMSHQEEEGGQMR